jgi:hypothetical protein
MSVNRIDATLTDDQRDRANAALAALADALPFPSSGRVPCSVFRVPGRVYLSLRRLRERIK